MNTEQRLFISFENKVTDLVITSMELLNNLNKMNGELSEEELYNLTLNVGNVGEEFATRSKILTQIKVPEKLPDDVQSSLEVVKRDLSIGFTELEEACFVLLNILQVVIQSLTTNIFKKGYWSSLYRWWINLIVHGIPKVKHTGI